MIQVKVINEETGEIKMVGAYTTHGNEKYNSLAFRAIRKVLRENAYRHPDLPTPIHVEAENSRIQEYLTDHLYKQLTKSPE